MILFFECWTHVNVLDLFSLSWAFSWTIFPGFYWIDHCFCQGCQSFILDLCIFIRSLRSPIKNFYKYHMGVSPPDSFSVNMVENGICCGLRKNCKLVMSKFATYTTFLFWWNFIMHLKKTRRNWKSSGKSIKTMNIFYWKDKTLHF